MVEPENVPALRPVQLKTTLEFWETNPPTWAELRTFVALGHERPGDEQVHIDVDEQGVILGFAVRHSVDLGRS